MKTHYTVALAMLAGFGLGAVAVQGLHAQAKPVVYRIAEIDITNPEAYAKEFLPLAVPTIKASGGRQLASGGTGGGGKITALEGEALKTRVAIQAFDSVEQIQAWLNSPAYKDARKIGEKYAKFRSFAIEGIPN